MGLIRAIVRLDLALGKAGERRDRVGAAARVTGVVLAVPLALVLVGEALWDAVREAGA